LRRECGINRRKEIKLSSWCSIKIVENSKVESWKVEIIAAAEEARGDETRRHTSEMEMTNTRVGEPRFWNRCRGNQSPRWKDKGQTRRVTEPERNKRREKDVIREGRGERQIQVEAEMMKNETRESHEKGRDRDCPGIIPPSRGCS
jgi:hypothetical protein